ncbi:helix-turn-helix domain-containing protein [Umezawaea endophytica]|uniref:Helix-turn-helix domain-containing protein n=1 Tax=Umezawaea endophytica TaxID=1654476 RepID=A0A9X2VMY7_9PSEU|nr:helix-turn-helix transcriptional regulator [Umezawaea endophytica]MCS7478193.1 helix-turn-helix domain-containing protein [Umezawaea endophytica]
MTPDNETKQQRTTTAQSRELGAELKAARRRAGLRGTRVTAELDWSTAKLSKLEKGWRGTSEWEIGVLLGKCGTDKPTRDRIMRLMREHHTGHFLRSHSDEPADVLLSLNLHERLATSLTCYEPLGIPALLQSEDYARALLFSATHPPVTVEPAVRRRMDRQGVLSGDHVDGFAFYIHEAALHLWVGDRATMSGQAERLVHLSTHSKLTFRVIPTSAGNHPALHHASTVLTFRNGLKPLAYGQSDVNTAFVEDEQAIKSHLAKHVALSALALDSTESRKVLTEWANDHSRPNEDLQAS